MAKMLYLEDCYLKEFDAKVVSVKDGKFVVLDQTAFYPNAGGQPNDEGALVRKSDNTEFKVVFATKVSGEISHEVAPVSGKELKAGDEVHGRIDWERRHFLMRNHTTAHIISAVINKATGALITGNQLGMDKSRIDFSLENYDPEKMKDYVDEANKIISSNAAIELKLVPREEAFKIPEIVRLAKGLPESIKEIRTVKIGEFDIQACAGCHVANTSEIGKIELLKMDNKGKSNRRMYFRLV
jgi:misacylated tRNA(Ala) deacylase